MPFAGLKIAAVSLTVLVAAMQASIAATPSGTPHPVAGYAWSGSSSSSKFHRLSRVNGSLVRCDYVSESFFNLDVGLVTRLSNKSPDKYRPSTVESERALQGLTSSQLKAIPTQGTCAVTGAFKWKSNYYYATGETAPCKLPSAGFATALTPIFNSGKVLEFPSSKTPPGLTTAAKACALVGAFKNGAAFYHAGVDGVCRFQTPAQAEAVTGIESSLLSSLPETTPPTGAIRYCSNREEGTPAIPSDVFRTVNGVYLRRADDVCSFQTTAQLLAFTGLTSAEVSAKPLIDHQWVQARGAAVRPCAPEGLFRTENGLYRELEGKVCGFRDSAHFLQGTGRTTADLTDLPTIVHSTMSRYGSYQGLCDTWGLPDGSNGGRFASTFGFYASATYYTIPPTAPGTLPIRTQTVWLDTADWFVSQNGWGALRAARASQMKVVTRVFDIFFDARWRLRTDHVARWEAFASKLENENLVATVQSFYLADEPGDNMKKLSPAWPYLRQVDWMETAARTIKARFPDIPVSVMHAYADVQTVVPRIPSADWVGMDCYGDWDNCVGQRIPRYLSKLQSRMRDGQKMIYMSDAYVPLSSAHPAATAADQVARIQLGTRYFHRAMADPMAASVFPYLLHSIPGAWVGIVGMESVKRFYLGLICRIGAGPCVEAPVVPQASIQSPSSRTTAESSE